MCGRYKGPDTWAELHSVLNMFSKQPDLFSAPAREIRPTNMVPIAVKNGDGQVEWIAARWGLIPHWHRKPVSEWKATSFNAKIEEAAEKPAYRTAWTFKHCVIPAASFWEWSGPHPTEAKKKQRYELFRADNHALAFAGLWDRAETPDGVITSCTILTKAPGPDFDGFHDREAVSLHPDQWVPWLDCVPMPELAEPSPPNTWRKVPVPSDWCPPEAGAGGPLL